MSTDGVSTPSPGTTSDTTGEATVEREVLKVFISYRVDPDAPLAAALKRLIEGAIEPQPTVFVSGGGGLRPSNLGFKRQLQEAARDAHAFVAIITSASKEREWIFFEAGAAWGQNLTYAPVLVGPRPSELPSSIGDYQAIDAQAKDQMQRLVASLAELAGAEVKDRFGQRYQSFAKTVSEYLQGSTDDEDAELNQGLYRAYRLAAQGDVERANELFARLEEKATDNEDRCHVSVVRVRALNKPQNVFSELGKLEAAFKDTSTFNLNMANETERPRVKQDYLRRAVQIGKGLAATTASLKLASLEFELGEDVGAIARLLTLLDQDPEEASEEAAEILANKTARNGDPLEQLTMLLAGFSGQTARGFRAIAELAATQGWNPLRLYCATNANLLSESGYSANVLGIARSDCKLASLAFEAYTRSFALGASVAKCNMALR